MARISEYTQRKFKNTITLLRNELLTAKQVHKQRGKNRKGFASKHWCLMRPAGADLQRPKAAWATPRPPGEESGVTGASGARRPRAAPGVTGRRAGRWGGERNPGPGSPQTPRPRPSSSCGTPGARSSAQRPLSHLEAGGGERGAGGRRAGTPGPRPMGEGRQPSRGRRRARGRGLRGAHAQPRRKQPRREQPRRPPPAARSRAPLRSSAH